METKTMKWQGKRLMVKRDDKWKSAMSVLAALEAEAEQEGGLTLGDSNLFEDIYDELDEAA